LLLAQEEAERRPKLVVSFEQVAFHHRPLKPGSKYVQAAIVLDIVNNGRSAAHNVTCEVRFEEQDSVPDDMHGVSRDYFALHMGAFIYWSAFG
jgi:hypothetical protein